MRLPIALRARRERGGPCAARVTAFEVEVAFAPLDDLSHFLAFPVKLAHCFGTPGQTVGGPVAVPLKGRHAVESSSGLLLSLIALRSPDTPAAPGSVGL